MNPYCTLCRVELEDHEVPASCCDFCLWRMSLDEAGPAEWQWREMMAELSEGEATHD